MSDVYQGWSKYDKNCLEFFYPKQKTGFLGEFENVNLYILSVQTI